MSPGEIDEGLRRILAARDATISNLRSLLVQEAAQFQEAIQAKESDLRASQRLAELLRHQVEAQAQAQVSTLAQLKAKDAEMARLRAATEDYCRHLLEKDSALRQSQNLARDLQQQLEASSTEAGKLRPALEESQKLAASLHQQLHDRETAVQALRADAEAKERVIQELKRVCDEREALIKQRTAR